MSQARVAVLKVITKELSVTAAAKRYGYSRQHLHRLLARYKAGGLDAVDPMSRRPHTSANATSNQVRDLIVELRLQLTKGVLDAGPHTIAWHLEQADHQAPSTSTIRRVLHEAGLVVPEPRKRPRSSYHRFEACQPNECWQSDFTHWRLADRTDTEILNWLDDHSRYLISCTAHTPVTGDDVVETYNWTATARSTTPNVPTGPWNAEPPPPPTPHYPKPAPQPATDSSPTTDCATTALTPGARPASAAPAPCTTSASATPTAAPGS